MNTKGDILFVLKRIDQYLANKPRGLVLAAGILLIALVALFSYAIGNTFRLDILYAVPIVVLTWFVGTEMGLAAALLSTLIGVLVRQVTGSASATPPIEIWNALGEFGLFFIITILAARLRQQRRQVEDLGARDLLTSVANRRSFFQAAETEIRRCKRYGSTFTFAYVDIDNFRLVNNVYGQNVGDSVLQQVAQAILTKTRDVDTVGRLGGDEFGVLFPQTDSEAASQLLKRIQELLADLIVTNRWPISFCIVVVTFCKAPPSTREMIERADKLMFSVKKSGKNGVALETWPEVETSGRG